MILLEFFDSDWTQERKVRESTRSAYFGLIGGWKESIVDKSIIHEFHSYSNRRAKEMAEEFFRDHGFEAEWK